MNVKLLEQICENIMRENTLFNMNAWFQKGNMFDMYPCNADDYCGTICCIAGHAIKLRYPNGVPLEIWQSDCFRFSALASRVLELNLGKASKLFYVHLWPSNYRDAYNEAMNIPRLRAKVTVNRIQHFIETGE